MEKMLLDSEQFIEFTIDVDFFQRRGDDQIEKVGQPDDVIQMSVREENGELSIVDEVLQPEDAGSRIEQDVGFAEKQRCRMTRRVGVVSSGS